MKPSDALDSQREELRRLVERHDLVHPRVFGSVARGEDTEESDLDLLVEPTPSTTLLTLAGLQIEAEKLLGVKVDVLTPMSLPPRYRNEILGEAMPL